MKIIKQDLKVYIYVDKDFYIGWYKNRVRHREDGPANIWRRVNSYHLKGCSYSKDDYWKKVHENY